MFPRWHFAYLVIFYFKVSNLHYMVLRSILSFSINNLKTLTCKQEARENCSPEMRKMHHNCYLHIAAHSLTVNVFMYVIELIVECFNVS